MPEAAVRLRGHHLLCTLSFVGKGYTPEFILNMEKVSAFITQGTKILLVEGMDDICAALHGAQGPLCGSGTHCLEIRATQRDQTAITSIGAALGLSLEVGSTLNLDKEQYAHLRGLFADGSLREACAGCEWYGTCTDIAQDGFRDVKLMPQAR